MNNHERFNLELRLDAFSVFNHPTPEVTGISPIAWLWGESRARRTSQRDIQPAPPKPRPAFRSARTMSYS